MEIELATDERNLADISKLGEPSIYTCPSCHGSLLRVANATPVRFCCHTGHAFTAVSLDDELRDKVEDSAWAAVRALQEHAMLLQELTRQPGLSNEEIADFDARAEQAIDRAKSLRETLAMRDESNDKPD